MALHNLPDELMSKQADFPASCRIIYVDGIGFMMAFGTTVPGDGATGYGKGCLFFHTDSTTDAGLLYVNVGDKDSSNFDQSGTLVP
jgi:hypothetical protein